MSTLRRFLVIQALMLWQGGFLFYAAVVVPIGTEVFSSFGQGMVTRHVTDWLNAIGAVAVTVLAWDQWANGDSRAQARARWGLWAVLTGCLAGLALVHLRLEPYVDSTMDPGEFYAWHRVYLIAAAVQWVAGLVYVVALLRAWARPAANGQVSDRTV